MNIDKAIVKYINSETLRQESDVIEYRELYFKRVEKNHIDALNGLKIFFENSFQHLIENCDIEYKKKENHIECLNELKKAYKIHHKMSNLIYNLCSLMQSLPETKKHQLLKNRIIIQCGIDSLHYLVWKYECLFKKRAEQLPRSIEDIEFAIASAQFGTKSINILIERKFVKPKIETSQQLDIWGISALKSEIHTLSELVATEAEEKALYAVKTFKNDGLSFVVPLSVMLRWKRGYSLALEKILKVDKTQRKISDYETEEPTPPCSVNDGIIKAKEKNGNVEIYLGNELALIVSKIPQEEIKDICFTLNGHGRLEKPFSSEINVKERIENIEIRREKENKNQLANFLYKNREALIPLFARKGNREIIPNAAWLFPDLHKIQKEETKSLHERHLTALPDVVQNMLEDRPENAIEEFLNAPIPLKTDSFDKDLDDQIEIIKSFFPGKIEEAEKLLNALKEKAKNKKLIEDEEIDEI
jgi:hypothetical protein